MLGVIHAEKSTPVIYFCSFCLLVLLLYLQFIRRSGDALKHVRDAAELETSEVEKRQAIEAQHQAERDLIGAREEERTRDEKRRAAKDKRRKEELLALSAQFETSVGKVSKSVAKAAKQFQITASTMSKQAEAAAQQIELIADGMGQVAAGSTAAAAASDEFTISIESVNAQAAEAADLARLTNQSAQATDETVSALTASAQQIGEIAQLIDSIAGRTRLLALNASIEAARGGKAGRGFAVVASEVKDLATKTSKATSDVAERIAKMQDGSQASAQELNAISSQIGQLEEAAIAIASAMDQQAVASKSLAQSIDMAASGAGEVSATTQDLRKAAKAVGVASHDLLVASDDIERQTALLNEEVAGFLAHIRSE
jgi:methyl-accepting chemotaxis protein